jgi:hypothetical protein
LALQCLADCKRARVEIDRVPREAERLALAEPEGQCHRPSRSIAATPRRFQDKPSVFAGQWPDLLTLDAGRIDECADVPSHLVPLHGDLQRP